jgi:hypothetical protein
MIIVVEEDIDSTLGKRHQMNKKTEIALLMGLSLLGPSVVVFLEESQPIFSCSLASLFAGTGILLLMFEVIELRSFKQR